MVLTAKVEMMRMDLEVIKREYYARVGRLYEKDDQLDLEIIRFKNLKQLIENGLTYDEAVKKIDEHYYSQKKTLFEENDIPIDEPELTTTRGKVTENTEKKIKLLWKKLLFKLHPDLTADYDEKVMREEIMKKINKAYEANDYETLKQIEQQHYVHDTKELSNIQLEQMVSDLENSIIALEMEHMVLKESEWYTWWRKSIKAKKKHEDIFKELEEKLLDDIAKKLQIVNKFRNEFAQKDYI